MASETSLLPDSGDTNLLSGRRKGSRPHNIETLASVPVNLEDNFLLEDLKSPIKTPRSPTKKKKNTVPSQLFPKVHYNRTESPAETSSAGRMRYNAQGGVGLTSPKKTGAGSNRERNRLPLIKTSYNTTNQGELAEQPLSGFESFIVAKIEDAFAQVKKQLIEKQKILSHFEKELVRMHTIFIKVIQVEKERKERKPEKFDPNEELEKQRRAKERLEAAQNGPFNIVFHGIKPDWIEAEMADDPDFKKDVLELRMKKLLKEEVGLIRDISLTDVVRYEDGPKMNDASPIIVSFKSRKDKEQVMWRCKDKLRKAGIMVTEDSATRQACARKRAAKAAEAKKAAEKENQDKEEAELEKSEAAYYQEMGLDFLF